ncbi:MAG: DUF885 family protein [Hyphomonadaceae bacterium]|nr:DUF885 family protein [Hyphomonadaceae bacterium]
MFLTRRKILAGASALALTACATKAAPPPAVAAPDLNAVLDRIATQTLALSPEYSTALAVSVERAGGPYITRLDDRSKAGFIAYRDLTQNGLNEIKAIDVATLNAQDKVSRDVVVASFENRLAALQFEFGSGAQSPYVVTQLTGAYTEIPDFLDSQHPVTSQAEADAYLERLAGYARALDQETQRMNEDAAAGIIPPDFAIDGAIRQLEGFIARAPDQTVLVQSLERRTAEVASIAAADRTSLDGRAEAIATNDVYPAYRRQIDALKALRPRATHDAGCWKLPRGEELYAAALKAYTTTNMGADEIHQMGLELVRQLNSEMDAILRGQGLTRGSIARRYQQISRRRDQLYPNTDAGREQLLAELNAQAAAMRARMPEVCGVQARAALEIKRVPPYTEAGAPGGYYQRGALDGSRPGAYYINLRDTREWPKFTLPTLTYHEGIPGHHWQISIGMEQQGLPFIRTALMGFSAYSEGWGLYAEQLADEMGVYADNPLGRLGYLQSAAFRASRLVVDTGMHAKRWTREQAIASMVEATGDQETSVTTEIERYSVWPGQACSYMVGRQAISRLREQAKTTLGAQFDIKAFHDTVLTNGAVPLTVLDGLVQSWIATVSGPAQPPPVN